MLAAAGDGADSELNRYWENGQAVTVRRGCSNARHSECVHSRRGPPLACATRQTQRPRPGGVAERRLGSSTSRRRFLRRNIASMWVAAHVLVVTVLSTRTRQPSDPWPGTHRLIPFVWPPPMYYDVVGIECNRHQGSIDRSEEHVPIATDECGVRAWSCHWIRGCDRWPLQSAVMKASEGHRSSITH